MWQRFSERARKVVFYAQEEAQKFGEGYVSTEHLLLGLVRESDGTAARVMERLGVSLNRIRAEVEKQLPRGEARPSQDMTLTPRAKRSIDLAFNEAKELGHNYIGTEHLLLGLIREGDGLAGRVLAKLGFELKHTRREVASQTESRTTVPTSPPVDRSQVPVNRYTAFLTGASLQEHLMLSLIAESGKAAGIIRAQVSDIGGLQWTLWQEIVRYSDFGVKRMYPEMFPNILELAKKEANGGEVRSEHILLALLDPSWKNYRFGRILEDAGLTLEESRRLVEGS